MLRSEPNKPMDTVQPASEATGEGAVAYSCYTAPGETFLSEADLKAHYRSELHRFNLKRKVAGLPPLPRETFEEREARRETAEQAAASKPKGAAERRIAREEKRQQRLASQSSNPHSKAAHFAAVAAMSPDEYVAHKIESAPTFDEATDIFSRHQSKDLHDNLSYMAKTHGFYVPHLEFCSDLPGLIGYLQEKVYIGNVALRTGKQFHSAEAVQAHMRAKGQCSFQLEGNEDEFAPFYDLEALAAGSPLWEAVSDDEYESELEDVEEGDEDDDADDADDAEGDGDGLGDDDDDGASLGDFDSLFEIAVRLGVLSEAQFDTLTDAVASGEATEEDLARKYRPLVMRAKRRAERGDDDDDDDGDDAATTTTTTVRRVRYVPLPSSTDAASLMLHGKEVGHRDLTRYYKQRFRPSGSSLVSASPRLNSLMLQYAKAGVLSSQLQVRMAQPHKHCEVGKKDIQRQARLYVKQGITNNTTANGMKHFKNRSLNF